MSDLRAALSSTRSQLKATRRSLNTSLQFLADLEEKLDLLDQDGQPKQEAHRNGSNSNTEARERISA